MKQRFSFLEVLLNNWWLRHFLFWIFVLNYFTWGFGIGPAGVKAAYIRIAMYIPGFMMVVYPLLYFLIPRYLVKRKYFLFITGLLGLILFAAIYLEVFQLNFHPLNPVAGFQLKWGKNLLPFIHITGIATAIKFIKYSYFQEDRAIKAGQQKTLAELELLKAQIHPHFLFNTLNNLFAHTLRSSADSPQIVSRLSDLLRFMIYESRQEFISIAQEIQLLQNYIDLEKLRYGQELDLAVNFSGNIDNKQIRPLLLLPLIENCFKHGMSQQLEQKWITMDLHVEKNSLYFKLANSKDPRQTSAATTRSTSGIGLENVRRRLHLLYPGKHKMEVIDQGDIFLVEIEMQVTDKYPEPVAVSDEANYNESEALGKLR